MTVPNVLEESQARAQELLEQQGFDVQALPRPSCAEPDSVVEQDPGAGEEADEGSTVTITVSTGQQVSVPQVAGLKAKEANRKLQNAELLVRSSERFSDNVQAGPRDRHSPERRLGGRLPVAGDPDPVARPERRAAPDVVGLQREPRPRPSSRRKGFIVDIDTRDADAARGRGDRPAARAPAAGCRRATP